MLTAHYLTPVLCWFARVELFEAVVGKTVWSPHWLVAALGWCRQYACGLTHIDLPAAAQPGPAQPGPSFLQVSTSSTCTMYGHCSPLSLGTVHSTQYSLVQYSGVQQPCSITIRDCNEDMARWRGSTLSTAKQMREVTSKFQLSFSSQIPVQAPCH